MKRVLFLFGMIFVAACTHDQDGYGSSGSWVDYNADGGASEPPWGEGTPAPPWADASPGDPRSDGGVDPTGDASVYPDDAEAPDGSCPPPPPPPPPPCGCPSPVDAGPPEVDAG